MEKLRFRLLALSLFGAAMLLPLSFFLGTLPHMAWLDLLVFRPPSYFTDWLLVHGFVKNGETAHKGTLLITALLYVWVVLLALMFAIKVWVQRKNTPRP